MEPPIEIGAIFLCLMPFAASISFSWREINVGPCDYLGRRTRRTAPFRFLHAVRTEITKEDPHFLRGMDVVDAWGDTDRDTQRGHTSSSPAFLAEACVSPSRVPFGVSRHVSKLYWIPSQDSPPHVFSPSAPCGAVRLVRLTLFSHLNLSSHSLEPPVSLRFPLFLSARSLSALLSNLIC